MSLRRRHRPPSHAPTHGPAILHAALPRARPNNIVGCAPAPSRSRFAPLLPSCASAGPPGPLSCPHGPHAPPPPIRSRTTPGRGCIMALHARRALSRAPTAFVRPLHADSALAHPHRACHGLSLPHCPRVPLPPMLPSRPLAPPPHALTSPSRAPLRRCHPPWATVTPPSRRRHAPLRPTVAPPLRPVVSLSCQVVAPIATCPCPVSATCPRTAIPRRRHAPLSCFPSRALRRRHMSPTSSQLAICVATAAPRHRCALPATATAQDVHFTAVCSHSAAVCRRFTPPCPCCPLPRPPGALLRRHRPRMAPHRPRAAVSRPCASCSTAARHSNSAGHMLHALSYCMCPSNGAGCALRRCPAHPLTAPSAVSTPRAPYGSPCALAMT
ncbi:hypothetical protein DENSPDRAFT_886396 [Dentipellis sp. KUC8613]|nr:hypothetical protein DENSPDRAFT_886396 [Dentipellis sp. KUC8613]